MYQHTGAQQPDYINEFADIEDVRYVLALDFQSKYF